MIHVKIQVEYVLLKAEQLEVAAGVGIVEQRISERKRGET